MRTSSQSGKHTLDVVDRDGESNSHTVADTIGEHGDVHPDDFAAHIQQRAARVPGVDRIADGHHPIASLERIGIAEDRDREVRWAVLQSDQRAVRDRVPSYDRGRIRRRLPPHQPDLDDIRISDDMVVGQDVAVGTDQKARPDFAVRLGPWRERQAEEPLEPLGILVRRGIAPRRGHDRDDRRVLLPRDGPKVVRLRRRPCKPE